MGVQSNLENSFKELWFVTSWLIRELKLQARYFQVKGLLVCVYAPSVGFPGGSVVKNLPANAGDTSSIPGLGRSRMPRGTSARVPWLLSLCSRAQEPQLLTPEHPRACAPQQDKPLRCEARACRKEA